MPHFSQYAANVLLIEPQNMQNLLSSELVFSTFELLGSREIGPWLCFGFSLGLLIDKTAAKIESAIATIIIMDKSGLSEIKLNDRGRTG